MGPLVFRPLASDADWQLATALRNGCQPSQPFTVPEMREAAAGRAKFGYAELGLFLDGDTPVGHGGATKAFWTGENTYFVFACPAREPNATHRYGEMIAIVEGLALGQGARNLQIHARTDLPWTLSVPPTMDYRVTQRNRALRLDLGSADFACIPGSRSGTEILSYPEFASRRLESWERDVWRLEMDLMADVPLPEPFQDIPFERFLTQLHSTHTHLRARFVALDGERLIGLTQLMPNSADPTIASTGLTGVLRDYRRKGVARALKLHALQWAKEHGITRVYTASEANNPMGQLNLDLGFVLDHEQILMAR